MSGSEPAPRTEDPGWVTVVAKREYVGVLDIDSLGGSGGTIRKNFHLPFQAGALRLFLRGERREAVTVQRVTISAGADTGSPIPVTFGGKPGASIKAGGGWIESDRVFGSFPPGVYTIQETLGGPRVGYAYDQGIPTCGPGEQHASSSLPISKPGIWPGPIFRVDALPREPTFTIACFGDSITQGSGSTKGTGIRYPELLGQLIGRPVLNLGVNGDRLSHRSGSTKWLEEFSGIQTVIVLMGINDLISGSITDLKTYQTHLQNICLRLTQSGKEVWVGTLTPAGGYEKFDARPEAENLRTQINDWIRSGGLKARVIDFDAALRDPGNPSRIAPGLSDDHLHPNNDGYQRMAEKAAQQLAPIPESL